MLRQLYSEISSCRKCIKDVVIGPTLSEPAVLDRFLFLPPRVENGVPKYVFITMEPTDLWCKSGEHGRKLISDGMVGFYHSYKNNSLRGPFILQFVANTFICRDGETYLITDLGKCSMPTRRFAEEIKMNLCPTISTRERRFENCLHFLKRELEIIDPKRIFTVGHKVDNYVKRKLFVKRQPWFSKYQSICSYIAHYSGDSQHSGVFNNYCDRDLEVFNKFKENHGDMQNRVNLFIERRKAEIENDGSVRPGSEAHKNVMYALDYNLRDLTDADWKMIFYYTSEIGKSLLVQT